jgi:lipopolysaccharide/colanic/teichoic acid biosynthesis glycosyltransferase
VFGDLRGPQLAIKRVLDLGGALAGLVVLAPLLLVIAFLIRRDSPGPVFYRQRRVGQGGRAFNIVKFRTMVDGADAQVDQLRDRNLYPDARLFKVVEDPRVTRVGRWLRRASLDELPQLWNVLKGEMSLVGPRPALPTEVALYRRHHYARFDAKPGITGPWQVAGRNEITDFNQIVMLETAYIRHWSLLSDLAILVRTIPAVFRMRGAL